MRGMYTVPLPCVGLSQVEHFDCASMSCWRVCHCWARKASRPYRTRVCSTISALETTVTRLATARPPEQTPRATQAWFQAS